MRALGVQCTGKHAFLAVIKAAPHGAASGAPRAGLCLGRPARRARAVPVPRTEP
jgi:hypothetical protein